MKLIKAQKKKLFLFKIKNLKEEEDEGKDKWDEEEVKIYAHKITKKLDILNYEDMNCLVEFLDKIKPEAIIEENNLVNIDITKFEQKAYFKVLN